MCKSLYKGYFQSRTILYVERCMAYSVSQAKFVLMRSIAKKAGVPLELVMDRFQDDKFCDVKLEVEFEEVDETENIRPLKIDKTIKEREG